MTDTLFYDGHCGLCHRAVAFIVKRDPAGTAFRFAPLQGPTCESLVSAEQRRALGDTMVVRRRSDAVLLTKSDAWVHILRRLGPGWRVVGHSIAVVPRPLRDAVYDAVARVRSRLFSRPDDVCPMLPRHLRGRFDP